MTLSKPFLIAVIIGIIGYLLFAKEVCNRQVCSVARDTVITIQKDTVYVSATPLLVSEVKKIVKVPVVIYQDSSGKKVSSEVICKDYISALDSLNVTRTYKYDSTDNFTTHHFEFVTTGYLEKFDYSYFIKPVKVTVQDKIVYRQYSRLFIGASYDMNQLYAGAKLNIGKWIFTYDRGLAKTNRFGVAYSILNLKTK